MTVVSGQESEARETQVGMLGIYSFCVMQGPCVLAGVINWDFMMGHESAETVKAGSQNLEYLGLNERTSGSRTRCGVGNKRGRYNWR